MSLRIILFAVFLVFISCSHQDKFPTPISESVDIDLVELKFSLPVNLSTSNSKIIGLQKLIDYSNQFQEKDDQFSLAEFKKSWIEVYRNMDLNNSNKSDIQQWFEITGLLLELTGEVGFATELERVALLGVLKNDQLAPYVFTKNLDNLFTNIFTPAKIEYNHTTGGEVKIEMLTDYPKSGKIELKFNMTERRYIEVNIRIPDWAEGATVTVKRVKYFAAPGTYCKIAKKWKEGDLVEIEFPANKIPEYLK